MSELLGYASLGTCFVDRGWKRDRHPREDDSFSVWGYGYIVVEAITDHHGSVISGGLLGIAINCDCLVKGPINSKRIHRRFILPLVGKVDALGIRRPREGSHPFVEVIGQIFLLARLA